MDFQFFSFELECSTGMLHILRDLIFQTLVFGVWNRCLQWTDMITLLQYANRTIHQRTLLNYW